MPCMQGAGRLVMKFDWKWKADDVQAPCWTLWTQGLEDAEGSQGNDNAVEGTRTEGVGSA